MNKKRKLKIARNILLGSLSLILVLATIAYAMRNTLIQWFTQNLPGNAEQYHIDNIPELSNSPLDGKTIIFLGSSVTQGLTALDVSFVDYLEKRDGIIAVKEAVAGTTLVTAGEMDKESYIPRMETIDTGIQVDGFVCQLSTNDAVEKKPLGTIAADFNRDSFDTTTTAGAIEYIISYARETWDCPVIFFTNPRFENNTYGEMVLLLLQIQEKWNIDIIDMWNDISFNNISDDERTLYMANDVHPTQAGYLLWWTPVFEKHLPVFLAYPTSIYKYSLTSSAIGFCPNQLFARTVCVCVDAAPYTRYELIG